MNRDRITGADALRKGNKSFRTLYLKMGVTAHVLLCSHLLHAAEHGDPSTLNEFFGILKTNDKTAARLYIGRVTAIVGGWDGIETVTTEMMSQYKATGAFIEYADKEFHIIPKEAFSDAPANRTAVLGFAAAMLDPDGEVWKDFLDRNNLTEIKSIGDEDVQVKLANLIKEASGDKKNTNTSVSDATLAALTAAQAIIGKPVKVIATLQ